MKYDGKAERISKGKSGIPLKKGYSLGTVYRVNPNTSNTYELLNFGYCPSDSTFYFNKNVKLQKEIVSRIEKMPVSKESSEFLLELGLYNYNDIDMLLIQYNKANENVEMAKRKILNLKQTLKKEDK